MDLRRRAAATLTVAATAVALTLSGSGPASTTSAAGPAPAACEPASSSEARLTRAAAEAGATEAYVDAAYRRALARGEQRGTTDVTPGPLQIKVYVHVIQDSDTVGAVSDESIASQIAVLNQGYAGSYNGTGHPDTQISFVLAGTTRTVNADWYPTSFYDQTAANAAKDLLHEGGRRDLNLYLTQIGSGVLGWATFPDSHAGAPSRDGVVLDARTMPGGSMSPYNLGATAIHEVGHWLGLFHTFEGGCGETGDLVDDTARERDPAFDCNESRDTCPTWPGFDPVRNFMDYTDDSCLYEFTPGQSTRMRAQTAAFRNTPPTVSGGALQTTGQAPVAFAAATSDADGDAVDLALTTGPAHGTVARSGSTFTYTAAAGFSGQDQFGLTATDALGTTATSTVAVTVKDTSIQLSVDAAAKQTLKKLSVTGSCGTEPCTVSVSGTVTATGKVHGKKRTKTFAISAASATSPAGGGATLRLTVQGAKKLTTLLKAGWKATATAAIVATDASGNTTSRTSSVRLRS